MHQTPESTTTAEPGRRLSRAALAGLLGLAAFAVITPAMVSGNAQRSVGSGAAADKVARPFVAQLTGAAEVPGPGDTDGAGAASITIDPISTEVCWDLRASNIDAPTMAHIHSGAAGVAGPVLIPLTVPNPTVAGCVKGSSLTPAVTTVMLEDIVANPSKYYVNVHNATFPNGAIRGQLAATTSFTGDVRVLAEPLRAYDSRIAGGVLTAGTTRVISLANGVDLAGVTQIAVPPGATAAIVKLTVTDAVNAGFLKMFSNALTTPPATATVNWDHTGTIVGETGPVAVDAEGKVKVLAGVSDTHFVIDIVGFIY